MGGVFSILADISAIASELSAATGTSVEAVLAGELAAAVESEASALMTVEGISGIEALTRLGITTEQFSLMYALPGMLSEAVGIGMFFQTITGASGLVAAGILQSQEQVSTVRSQNMSSLIEWRPEDYYDILFPGVSTFSYYMNIAAGWAGSLFHAVGRSMWEAAQTYAWHPERPIAIDFVAQELARRTSGSFQHTLAQILEKARWVVTGIANTPYSYAESYYRALPKQNPAQMRQQARMHGRPIPDRLHFYSPETSLMVWENAHSGELIEMGYQDPGGAHQRSTPDWMLPLILGLYGDITPVWGTYLHKLEEEEDGPKKKRQRTKN
ncbi:minor capsid protein VP2 [Myotis horsfieldii polyomavirus 2]|nr:minor capsid protein VP2 [Myotis horsfieldii polyomavirus 2]